MIAEAKSAGERGAAIAAANAAPGFVVAAEAKIRGLRPGHRFLAEDVIDALRIDGVVTHENRAIGAVVLSLARKGIVHKVGFAPARTSHGSAKSLWERS